MLAPIGWIRPARLGLIAQDGIGTEIFGLANPGYRAPNHANCSELARRPRRSVAQMELRVAEAIDSAHIQETALVRGKSPARAVSPTILLAASQGVRLYAPWKTTRF